MREVLIIVQVLEDFLVVLRFKYSTLSRQDVNKLVNDVILQQDIYEVLPSLAELFNSVILSHLAQYFMHLFYLLSL